MTDNEITLRVSTTLTDPEDAERSYTGRTVNMDVPGDTTILQFLSALQQQVRERVGEEDSLSSLTEIGVDLTLGFRMPVNEEKE